jgi:threonylcarbamoyladenosine tRNA methylthiotransferase MtaB
MNNTFYIYTLGCKLNFAESSALVRRFNEFGWKQTRVIADASLIIVHSCAVTQTAEKKTRQLISKYMRQNSQAAMVITGCMADVNVESLDKMNDGRRFLIVNNVQKMQIPDLIAGKPDYRTENIDFSGAYSLEQRTRSFLKIQDGCDYYCTYCTVPYARGHSRSNSIEGVLADISDIIIKGFKEINLTGVNIATFGQERNETFFQLLDAIDKRFSDIRIRLGSNEPDLLSNETIELVSTSNILMPHFHVPLQSGTDSVLKRMHRHYNTDLFRSKVELIKQRMPFACIAADVITGFPGETVAEFEETCRFIESLDISYLHVFPYSDRPLAKASQYPDHVDSHEIRQRVNRLLELGQQKQEAFFRSNLGYVRPMLTEATIKDNLRFGFTDNYIKCALPAIDVGENIVLDVKLTALSKDMQYILAY